MFGYSLNYLIDTEHAIIVDVEATPTRISKEVDAAETMVARTEERFDLKPDNIAGDVAYGTGEMLGWLVEREIDPHIPVWDKGKRHGGRTLLYRSSKSDCDRCPLKPRCCPTAPSRKVPRDVNEAARDHVRSMMGTDAYR